MQVICTDMSMKAYDTHILLIYLGQLPWTPYLDASNQIHPDRSPSAPAHLRTLSIQHAPLHRIKKDAMIHPRCVSQAYGLTVRDSDPDDMYAEMVQRGTSRPRNSCRRMGVCVGKGRERKKVLGGHFGRVLQQILSAVVMMVAVVSAQKGQRINENLIDERQLNTHFHRARCMNRAYLLLLLPLC